MKKCTRMKRNSCYRIRTMCSMFFLLFLLCIFSVPAFAGGVAAGSGGGADVSLHMRDCSLANGQKDVPLDVQITLYYSHNVADAAVQKNNTAAIHMADSAGNPVSLTVSYSSVFEYRQEIYVKPSGLLPDTTYVLTVDPGLMSRNGYTTGKTDTITFTTAKQSQGTNAGSSNGTAGSGHQPDQAGSNQASQPAGTSQGAGTSGTAAGTQDTGSAGQKRDTVVHQAAGSSGSIASESQNAVEQGAVTTEDSQKDEEEIEEEQLQEALDAGFVLETDEIEIVKVSDQKPGRVEQSETETEDPESEPAKVRTSQNTVILVVVLVIAGVGIGLLYYRKKKHGKSV